jgi:hypothetical protein
MADMKNLSEIMPISDDVIKRGFASAFWAARN